MQRLLPVLFLLAAALSGADFELGVPYTSRQTTVMLLRQPANWVAAVSPASPRGKDQLQVYVRTGYEVVRHFRIEITVRGQAQALVGYGERGTNWEYNVCFLLWLDPADDVTAIRIIPLVEAPAAAFGVAATDEPDGGRPR